MQSSEEMICKTLGEVCVLTQIVYKHQIQQPSTMSIIISTVLLRQDFMQKIVVINFSYLWVRHLGSLHFWYISYHSMHGDLEQGHNIRQGLLPVAMSHRCKGLQASEARGLLRYTLVQDCSTMFNNARPAGMESEDRKYVDYKRNWNRLNSYERLFLWNIVHSDLLL